MIEGVEALTLRLDSCPKVLEQMLHSYLIFPFCFFSGYGRDLWPGPLRGAVLRLVIARLRFMASSQPEGDCSGD